jgi:type II secretory pathway component PulJ
MIAAMLALVLVALCAFGAWMGAKSTQRTRARERDLAELGRTWPELDAKRR